MKKLIDAICPSCDHINIDVWVNDHEYPLCSECGAETERAYLPSSTAVVIGDDLPGGVEIRHGLCNPDGSPRRYYSKSEIAAEAKRRGLVNEVEHMPARGSDKSKHTSRWV